MVEVHYVKQYVKEVDVENKEDIQEILDKFEEKVDEEGHGEGDSTLFVEAIVDEDGNTISDEMTEV